MKDSSSNGLGRRTVIAGQNGRVFPSLPGTGLRPLVSKCSCGASHGRRDSWYRNHTTRNPYLERPSMQAKSVKQEGQLQHGISVG